MRISARTDYAIRAVVAIAAASGAPCTEEGQLGEVRLPDGGLPDGGFPGPATVEPCLVKAEFVSREQRIPLRFLLGILGELRRAGIVESRRGTEGGYRLARPPGAITVADVIRAVDGPLANVAGTRPDELDLPGPAAPLREVWVAVRASLRSVLERVTVADIVAGALPPVVDELVAERDAWIRR